MAKNSQKGNGIVEPRINHEINGHTEVRLIYKEFKDRESENDFNKVVSWKDAIAYSKQKSLDLIEINGNCNPAIIRLADYSKYLYELKKQMKQKKKNTCELKEVQLSVNISTHDLQIKERKAIEFIEDGDKVKVVLRMKGRELARREESKKCFYQFIQDMLDSGVATLESSPRDDEKNSIVIFKKK